MSTMEINKRFTVQILPLLDLLGDNIANVQLDLRFVSKKELLDLMYSPRQLADNKMERNDE